jgi:hypothetical protein
VWACIICGLSLHFDQHRIRFGMVGCHLTIDDSASQFGRDIFSSGVWIYLTYDAELSYAFACSFLLDYMAWF